MFSFLELFILTSLSSSVSAGPSIYKTLPFDNYIQLFFLQISANFILAWGNFDKNNRT